MAVADPVRPGDRDHRAGRRDRHHDRRADPRRAVRGADRRPQRLLAMQPARIPGARLASGDAIPESLDRTRELE